MSFIQNIREKYAKWAVVAIALALLGFILTDYLSAKNRASGGGSTTVGTVNGIKIGFNEFETRLKNREAQMQTQGQQLDENTRHQVNENLWNNEVEQILMNEEFEKLGIAIGKKEINEWLFGPNPPEDLKQRFTGENGQYDPAAVQNAFNQMKRSANPADRQQLNAYIGALEYSRQTEKYNSLLTNSVYFPKWFIEKQNAEASGIANISYVSYPYTNIADSTIKISDKEIEEYISKNKDQYHQEASRSIAYVVFDAAPTAEDSAEVRNSVAELRPEFETAKDPAQFLARYGSAMQYFDQYVGQSQIQVPEKDSIFNLPINGVYGPYQDGGMYVMAKKIAEKTLPDSVKARHILIQTYNPQSGQQLLDDSTAKKRIDSIDVAIKNGARFDSLAKRFSDDKGSGADGGLLANPQNPLTNYFTAGQMVPEFNDFCFEGKTGEMKIVKTVFGYHLIEILDQKNFEPHYKIAYFGKNIIASDETDRVALEAANKFASESRTLKAFDENIEKLKSEGYQKLIATNIKPTDISITGIDVYGASRQLVREIYKADKGDVLQQERVGDKYIVVAVTDVLKEGTTPVASARPFVEPALRNKKKAEQIKKQIGTVATLDAAATAMQDSIKTADSVRFSGGGPLGYEPKVLGAAFNPSNKGKFVNELIAGQQAVYAIRVDDQSTTANTASDIETQRNNLVQRTKQYMNFYSSPIALLKKEATIKDNRANFY